MLAVVSELVIAGDIDDRIAAVLFETAIRKKAADIRVHIADEQQRGAGAERCIDRSVGNQKLAGQLGNIGNLLAAAALVGVGYRHA